VVLFCEQLLRSLMECMRVRDSAAESTVRVSAGKSDCKNASKQ